MPSGSDITALIITYAPDADVLGACVRSLQVQEPSPHILLVDNLAPSDPDHSVVKSFESSGCEVLTLDRNTGFGGAINIALKRIDTKYVLISNFDIVYDRDYMKSAVASLDSASEDVVGIAGKTLFYPPNADENWPGRGPDDPPLKAGRGTGGVIDNTGTLVNGYMLAYNRGVGQIDIGQFDKPDRPMGACFAAFLARRSAFEPISKGGVGLLDAPYFMYYEDIDWCYRANLLGYSIQYEPKAVAWHHHSLTTRDKSLFFKYHLIQRNLYRTIMKNMRFRTVIRLWLMHARLHIRRSKVEREFGTVTAKILGETLIWAPAGLMKRIPIQARRKMSDTDIVNLSIGEEGHLDDITLRPRADWRNVFASLERLCGLFPDDPACGILPMVRMQAEEADESVAREIMDAMEEACPALVPLMRQIGGNSGRNG